MTDKSTFLTDRMLGALTRYLRFLGYDTKSADILSNGNSNEDTILLKIAKDEGRYLLTRDKELFLRGRSESAVYIESDEVLSQIKQLFNSGLIDEEFFFGMQRCVVCNLKLRPATEKEVETASYAPKRKEFLHFMWCEKCKKLYWPGTHSLNMQKRLAKIFENQVHEKID